LRRRELQREVRLTLSHGIQPIPKVTCSTGFATNPKKVVLTSSKKKRKLAIVVVVGGGILYCL
jgi:hypothetical protein